MAISVIPAPSGGASKILKTDTITATSTWTAPADVTQVEVWLSGGGGSGAGGAAANSCGGGGSLTRTILNVTPSTSYTITIGAGGAGVWNSNYANGNSGGSSSFGGLLTVTGGGGGQGYQSNSGAFTLGGTPGGNHGAYGGVRFYNTASYTFAAGEPLDSEYNLGQGGSPNDYYDQAGSGANYLMMSREFGGGATGGISYAFAGATTQTIKNGRANTGAGGAGFSGGNSTTGLSGAGGSGVCIIKYWSAL